MARKPAHRQALEGIILFRPKEKKDTETVIKAKNAGMASGATTGLIAGGIIASETGGMNSQFRGMSKAMEQTRQYAAEDQTRAARKSAERYTEIEGPSGERVQLLKNRIKPEPVPLKGRIGSMLSKAKAGLGSGATRLKYAAEDAMHGAGKWATRNSVSRTMAIGALAGAGLGRYLGGKSGEAIQEARRENAKKSKETRIRKQATEVAKAQVMAQTIIDGLNKQRNLSARDQLNSIIEFARGDRIISSLEKWGSRQKRDVRKITKEALSTPGVKSAMRRDPEALAEEWDMPVGMAHELMPIMRKQAAKSYWDDKKSGVLSATGLNVKTLLHHRGLHGFSSREQLHSIIELGLREDIDNYKSVGLKRTGTQPGFKHIKPMHLIKDEVTKSHLALSKGSTLKDLFAKVLKSRQDFRLSPRDQLQEIIQLAAETADPFRLIALAAQTADRRPRNPLGMFSDNADMGPDPNAIHEVYKAPIMKRPAVSGLAAKLRQVKR